MWNSSPKYTTKSVIVLLFREPTRKTATSLSPRSRLYVVLSWLRQGGRYLPIANAAQVSRSFLSRDIHHIIPLLVESLNYITFPTRDRLIFHPFNNTSMVIDCTALARVRVHPKQADYYRKDKGFSLLLQLICGLDGTIFSIEFLKGHNNDKGAFNKTGVGGFLERNDLYMLADAGYPGHHRVITPNKNKIYRKDSVQLLKQILLTSTSGIYAVESSLDLQNGMRWSRTLLFNLLR